MSKVGEKPVIIEKDASFSQTGREIRVRGPLGEIHLSLPDEIEVELSGKEIVVKRLSEGKRVHSLHGTIARLIRNAILGVTRGFEKSLEIVGTGYRAQMEGESLILHLGFSHPVKFTPPAGIKISVIENRIRVEGVDKEMVGNTAYKIRFIKKPDPYKGKGIRYLGEKLKLKPGKAVAKTAGPVAK